MYVVLDVRVNAMANFRVRVWIYKLIVEIQISMFL